MSGFARFVLPFALAASPAAAQLSTVEGQEASAVPAAALATATLPIAADDPMPKAPARVSASFATPVRDALGRYATPNRDLTAPETLWHLRVALNVAALGCRDADEVATVAAYNAMLAKGRAELATAQAQMLIVYRQRHGKAAQARNDDAMTKLYNFFAQPTGHEDFCTSAKAVLAEVATVAPAAFGDYAAAALPRLEAPFVLFFANWDAYRDSLSAWQARRTAPSPVAAPAVVMVASVQQPAAAPVAAPAVILAAAAPAVAVAPAPTPAIVAAAPAAVVATAPAAPGAPAQVMVALTPEALAAIRAAGITGVTVAGVPVASAAAPAAAPSAIRAVALVVKRP